MPNKRSELLAPAGGFSAGVYALRNGADAVYLGLKAFSARKSARNFSLDELSAIKAFAEREDKRVYAAFNTLVRDGELAEAAELLHELEALEIDGVIVQDLGMLRMLRRHFPGLAVHASTQMAVHNSEGVAFLKREGVRRVVLARELSWEEIAAIRRDHEDIELEVFIHGALCYSFSGLCLASGMLLGRSGNRGECAQICRSWFESDGVESLPPRGYYFSCNDLWAGDEVLRLQELGVDSFKIEGRMKPPEWVSAVVSYYRTILIGGREKTKAEAAEKARTIFSRRTTRGYGPAAGGENILSADYPGHRGIPAGTVESVRREGFVLVLETDLSLRDGLLFFQKTGSGDFPRPVPFAATFPAEERRTSARAGERVLVASEPLPGIGDRVYKISSHSAALPEVTENFPKKTIPVALAVRLLPGEIRLEFIPGKPLLPPAVFSRTIRVEGAKKARPFRDVVEERLSAPGDSRFSVESFAFVNESGFGDEGIFVNPSELKETRRWAFALLEEAYVSARTARAAAATGGAGNAAVKPDPLPDPGFRIPERALVADRETGLPFVADPRQLAIGRLHRSEDGFAYLALAPVLFRASDYLARVEAFIRRSLREDGGIRFRIGLGNVGHLGFASSFAEEERVEFFADWGLYAANRETIRLLRERVPRLSFYYPWIENPAPAGAGLPAGRFGNFKPPLFLSRACVWKQAAGASCEGCAADRSTLVRQGKRSFRLRTVRVAGSCISLLSEA